LVISFKRLSEGVKDEENSITGKLNTIGIAKVNTQACQPPLTEDLKEPAACTLCKCELTI